MPEVGAEQLGTTWPFAAALIVAVTVVLTVVIVLAKIQLRYLKERDKMLLEAQSARDLLFSETLKVISVTCHACADRSTQAIKDNTICAGQMKEALGRNSAVIDKAAVIMDQTRDLLVKLNGRVGG
jgi:hypothetical protein